MASCAGDGEAFICAGPIPFSRNEASIIWTMKWVVRPFSEADGHPFHCPIFSLHSKVYNLLLTQLLLIQNHFQTLVHIPAHFAKAVFHVEPLGRNLEDGGVQMQGLIAQSAGTGFELIQNELAVAAPLILRMDAHAFDLGALWTRALQSTHRHKQAIAFPNQKFSPLLEIHFLDSIDIIIPGTTPQVGSGLLNGMHMQICDSFSIGRLITAQGEHETCPHNFSRIAKLPSGAIGCLYLLISVPSSGSRKDSAPATPRGKVYTSNPQSANALRMISVGANLCQA